MTPDAHIRAIEDPAERRKELLRLIWRAQVKDMPPYIWDLVADEIGVEVQKKQPL
jgi:hypothetical protein